jgi:hypothetical protein
MTICHDQPDTRVGEKAPVVPPSLTARGTRSSPVPGHLWAAAPHLNPSGVLQLQRTLGNRAVGRLLSSHGPLVVQRVAREGLNLGMWVTIDDRVVIHTWFIARGTQGVVVGLPSTGVRVKLKSGEYEGETIELGEKYLSLDSAGDKRNLDANRVAAEKLVDAETTLDPAVAREIKESLLTPEKIDQGGFNFCGPNHLLISIALRDPVAYVKYVLDVYRAQAEFGMGKMAPGRSTSLGKMSVSMDPMVVGTSVGSFAKGVKISQTDWMTMGSLRSHGTSSAVLPAVSARVQTVVDAFNTGGAAAALTVAKSPNDIEEAIMIVKKTFAKTPSRSLADLARAPKQTAVAPLRTIAEGSSSAEVAKWMAEYGAQDVVQNAAFDRGRRNADLQHANSDFKRGRSVMLQIDARGLNGDPTTISFDPTKGHWVLMDSEFVKDAGSDPAWVAEVYTWGTKMKLKIVDRLVSQAFYGYVSARIVTPH